MKSIEAAVPYNKIALNNRQIEKYLHLAKQTMVLDNSSIGATANVTGVSFGRGFESREKSRESKKAKGFDPEEAGSAVKLVEEKLIKIHDEQGHKMDGSHDREIIAEESHSLADGSEGKINYKRVKMPMSRQSHKPVSRQSNPSRKTASRGRDIVSREAENKISRDGTASRTSKQPSNKSSLQPDYSKAPGFTGRTSPNRLTSHNHSLDTIARREISSKNPISKVSKRSDYQTADTSLERINVKDLPTIKNNLKQKNAEITKH